MFLKALTLVITLIHFKYVLNIFNILLDLIQNSIDFVRKQFKIYNWDMLHKNRFELRFLFIFKLSLLSDITIIFLIKLAFKITYIY